MCRAHAFAAYCLACVASVLLQACTTPYPHGQLPYGHPYGAPVSVVSSHSQDTDMMSALQAAQFEETLHSEPSAATQRSHSPRHAARKIAIGREWGEGDLTNTNARYNPDLWQPAELGDGLTLMDASAQRRLNDALQTTPAGGKATFKMPLNGATMAFVVLPNTPLYTPQHSGGRCRDALLQLHDGGFTQATHRGLFCQAGPRSDFRWLRD